MKKGQSGYSVLSGDGGGVIGGSGGYDRDGVAEFILGHVMFKKTVRVTRDAGEKAFEVPSLEFVIAVMDRDRSLVVNSIQGLDQINYQKDTMKEDLRDPETEV